MTLTHFCITRETLLLTPGSGWNLLIQDHQGNLCVKTGGSKVSAIFFRNYCILKVTQSCLLCKIKATDNKMWNFLFTHPSTPILLPSSIINSMLGGMVVTERKHQGTLKGDSNILIFGLGAGYPDALILWKSIRLHISDLYTFCMYIIFKLSKHKRCHDG